MESYNQDDTQSIEIHQKIQSFKTRLVNFLKPHEKLILFCQDALVLERPIAFAVIVGLFFLVNFFLLFFDYNALFNILVLFSFFSILFIVIQKIGILEDVSSEPREEDSDDPTRHDIHTPSKLTFDEICDVIVHMYSFTVKYLAKAKHVNKTNPLRLRFTIVVIIIGMLIVTYKIPATIIILLASIFICVAPVIYVKDVINLYVLPFILEKKKFVVEQFNKFMAIVNEKMASPRGSPAPKKSSTPSVGINRAETPMDLQSSQIASGAVATPATPLHASSLDPATPATNIQTSSVEGHDSEDDIASDVEKPIEEEGHLEDSDDSDMHQRMADVQEE
ncbi:hypothetical protein ADUPG1_011364 [Aduncisulcus paluster]|uniref:RETREG1-3/ARL6IP-like N-terminal reticulon-homology domain-containing protein n=1 Tax=Aduncisulcus paluster TaxID=2918883 RepID=A0ABQ5JVC1_9EUKA|nr:hypothetical protein ADUPG1_011364 [Aduncisulcus paluster]|eukprot:gnl/Carplike_NY0171/2190_a2949_776.p1 GENE.gnl/Carplike_NY0171/2190_a2949_776~~gnl/Carplike_NY0171/2190_a2949_776.p1  ORF type:complete len:335 (-),score=105.30 gnl/Carplike_NY0171/2190_a2949_776:155-1159(-)